MIGHASGHDRSWDKRVSADQRVRFSGRTLSLSNPDKVLYPVAKFTKGDVVDYYRRIAATMLPHLAGRPATLKRYPDGVEAKSFFQKQAPAHPDWVRTATLRSPGSTKHRNVVTYAVLDEPAALVWSANLAALELHVPMWRLTDDGQPLNPDALVVDLDPGPPATIVECCRVARLVRDALRSDGLSAYPKTSGSKGLQLYAPIEASQPWREVHGYAKRLAEQLESEHPDLVVSSMAKNRRGGKVLLDWSQNNPAKTTVAPYSLRAKERPTVSTPLSWREVTGCERSGDPGKLVFTAPDVLARVKRYGDRFSAVLSGDRPVPTGGSRRSG
jgi:bifunctional non-homologous end joining protein LigD